MAFVIGCTRYCLPLIKRKLEFWSRIKKLYSLDGVRTTLFGQIIDINTIKGKNRSPQLS